MQQLRLLLKTRCLMCETIPLLSIIFIKHVAKHLENNVASFRVQRILLTVDCFLKFCYKLREIYS